MDWRDVDNRNLIFLGGGRFLRGSHLREDLPSVGRHSLHRCIHKSTQIKNWGTIGIQFMLFKVKSRIYFAACSHVHTIICHMYFIAR